MAVRCRTCKKPAGEVFGFCYSCGEPLCPECLWKYPRTHVEEKITGVPGVVSARTTLTQRLPRCVGCTNAYIRAHRQAKKLYLRDAVMGTLAFLIPVWIISIYLLAPQMTDIANLVVCTSPLGLLPALILGYIVASTMRKSRLRKALEDLPLAFESDVFCPRCGTHARTDIFKTTKKMIKGRKKSRLDSLFRYSGPVPDFFECSNCRYSGPISPVMGLYLYVQKYGKEGKERLKGTVWEPLSESMT